MQTLKVNIPRGRRRRRRNPKCRRMKCQPLELCKCRAPCPAHTYILPTLTLIFHEAGRGKGVVEIVCAATYKVLAEAAKVVAMKKRLPRSMYVYTRACVQRETYLLLCSVSLRRWRFHYPAETRVISSNSAELNIGQWVVVTPSLLQLPSLIRVSWSLPLHSPFALDTFIPSFITLF